MTARPKREAARVFVVDEDERVLLVRFDLVRGGHVWATVGGGSSRARPTRTPRGASSARRGLDGSS